MKSWQLQQAKAHLSLLVREVLAHGPQEISLRGEPAVVIISKKEYNKLTKPNISFVAFMRQSPLMGSKLILKRDKSLPRDIDL